MQQRAVRTNAHSQGEGCRPAGGLPPAAAASLGQGGWPQPALLLMSLQLPQQLAAFQPAHTHTISWLLRAVAEAMILPNTIAHQYLDTSGTAFHETCLLVGASSSRQSHIQQDGKMTW